MLRESVLARRPAPFPLAMIAFLRLDVRPTSAAPVWDAKAPIREELFGTDRLEQHGRSLAAAQTITRRPPRVPSLHRRLRDNADALLAAYRVSALAAERGQSDAPAAQWLLDNYHLVDEQIRQVRSLLPRGFYRELPKLEHGPFAGYPRVIGIAWAFVAHSDSHFDPRVLKVFLDAYQSVDVLTIGELWAVAITLRIVLIENLRRITDELAAARRTVEAAEALADRALAPGFDDPASLDAAWEAARGPFLDVFGAQLAKRLRDQDPTTTPALAWLDQRLAKEGLSIDDIVQRAQQRQGAANVTTRNIITSLRAISSLDWAAFFESVSAVDATLRAGSAFGANDFATRNLYRNAIEALSRGSPHSEVEVAKRVLRIAAAARTTAGDAVQRERVGDPGYHLIAEGRPAFENALAFVPPLRERLARFNVRLGIDGYAIAILALTGALLVAALSLVADPSIPRGWLTVFSLFAFIPISEAATAIVGVAVTRSIAPVTLPALDLAGGPDADARTLIAMPTLLTNADDVREQVAALEVHHLSGTPGEFYFAIVSDWTDSDREHRDDDLPLLAVVDEAIARLNARYPAGPAGPRFTSLHRRRVFDASEDRWIGRERKRGKLHDLNRLLRGATDTTFVPSHDRVPDGVRYVVTLDADTRLPRDAALRLVGKMRHPLNRPFLDAVLQRVTSGYGILQPRVAPSLVGADAGSMFQTAFSGPGGIDPYAGAVSDVYQDLAGEGSYVGKGIYDVDAFEAALAGRVPDDTMLSHDLFEGVYARAGLASDVEVIEDFPTRYEIAIQRLHRWTRGDWQLLPWIVGLRRGPGGLPAEGRWKMLDNLRRSVSPACTVIAIGLCWLLQPRSAWTGQAVVVGALALPSLIPASFAIAPRRGVRWSHHLRALGADLRLAATQIVLSTGFLADRGWRLGDGIVRTLWRMLVSRRRLLEWTTAAQAARGTRQSVATLYRTMAGGCAFVVAMAAVAIAVAPRPSAVTFATLLPLAALWLVAPLLARWSGAPSESPATRLPSPDDARALRLVARRTWRYFETFVTADENALPPDNFQEDPKPVVARRTSPTNIGLYLLSCVVARDLGWIGTVAAVERMEATFATLRRLVRFNGHFYNWYDTRDLRPLEPAYVSSVDSGNLAGHLIALANACDAWRRAPVSPLARNGLADTLELAKEAATSTSPTPASRHGFAEMTRLLAADEGLIDRRMTAVAATADRLLEGATLAESDPSDDLLAWLRALRDASLQHRADLEPQPDLDARLAALASEARAIAVAMDFRFLFDDERKLLSIGYSLADNRLDAGCYDLLASEARLASLVAIAKGDVPAKHWFRLGRATTPVRHGLALLSWSGSMFEYLMPSLVLREPVDSLLAQSNRMAVARQRDYAASRGVPWGISESAFNARDFEFTYQYSNFGVPGLGLKRGLDEDLVVAPYATGLATMVDPAAAARELPRARGARRARPLRLPRIDRLHAVAAAAGRHVRAGTQLHGAPPGHDDRRDRQRRHRRCDARLLPRRADDRRERAAAAGTRAARHRRAAGHRRAASARRDGVRHGARGASRVRRRRRSAGDAPAVERPLQRDGDERRRWLQPLARHRDHALARGSDARRRRLVPLSARPAVAAGVVGRGATVQRAGAGGVGRPRRGSRRLRTSRRPADDDARGARVGRGRRRGAPPDARQPRSSSARHRGDDVCRARADDGRGRCRASGVREDVRRDRIRRRARRADRDASAALRRRGAGLGGPLRRRAGRGARRRRSTRPIACASSVAATTSRTRPRCRPTRRCRAASARCSTRSSRCATACACRPAAPCRSRGGRWSRRRATSSST